MPTLVLPPRYTNDSIILWRAAQQAGWEVERLQSWHPPLYLAERNVAIYGEALFVEHVANSLSLTLLEAPFDFLTGLPSVFRRRAVQYTTLEEARRIKETAFIKPADEKAFPALVYESGTQLPTEDLLPGDLPVLVSEPVNWSIEFRCFILERSIVTFRRTCATAN